MTWRRPLRVAQLNYNQFESLPICVLMSKRLGSALFLTGICLKLLPCEEQHTGKTTKGLSVHAQSANTSLQEPMKAVVPFWSLQRTLTYLPSHGNTSVEGQEHLRSTHLHNSPVQQLDFLPEAM